MLLTGECLKEAVFYFFAGMLCLSSLMVILAKNPVRSLLFLIGSMFMSGVLWILLQAEFLAFTLIIVYVGAVMVLFLFVVMMLNLDPDDLKHQFIKYLPLAGLGSLLVLATLVYCVSPEDFGTTRILEPLPYPVHYNNTKALGALLYNIYLYPFEIAGVILLVSIVAAISLVFRGQKQSLSQNVSKQVTTHKGERLKVLKVASESYLKDEPEK